MALYLRTGTADIQCFDRRRRAALAASPGRQAPAFGLKFHFLSLALSESRPATTEQLNHGDDQDPDHEDLAERHSAKQVPLNRVDDTPDRCNCDLVPDTEVMIAHVFSWNWN
ncbi:hypothetical protein [Burkholderia vietnamiensis]|uniref:hypothetical protein n=1 Tax=Burkholderia vietnamiensis TaxID=60552 RepID=UPI00159483C0|nr:hypothetical protein [Burkholderia vietnamiensis]